MFSKYIARQFGKPMGLGGVLSTFIMNRQNGNLYESVLDNINMQTNDKIFTINTLYFWIDTSKSFSEIKRTLKSNGIFLNVFYVKEFLDKITHTRYGYSKYTLEQITDMTEKSGLKVTRIIEIQPNASFCIIAEK